MTGALLVVVFVILALGVPLVLYSLVQSETNDRTTLDRSEAERVARERSAERYRDGDERS